MSSTVFDYAIIGAGAAGLNLAMAMAREPFFSDKKILLLDKEKKTDNDRTWCFWEIGSGTWDPILSHQWSTGKFITDHHNMDLKIAPYKYKMLESSSFYKYARSKLATQDNFQWAHEEVDQVLSGASVHIKTNKNQYNAGRVFDSRISPDFYKEDKFIRVLQHFKGWFIESKQAVFDPKSFTMMDYRLKFQDSASFMYVLPTSKTEALVEFTFFSPELVSEDVYDHHIEKYLNEVLGLKEYSVKSFEKGIIPMSNFPFQNTSLDGVLKIGTAGGWVKPSSGYSFKNAERLAKKIVDNLVAGKPVQEGLFKKKYHVYDTLFLDVLSKKNELGEELFTTMYTKNSIHRVFEFLDEQTNILQDIAIMNTFDWQVFFKAIRNQYLKVSNLFVKNLL